jgi:mRNA interferase HicA
LPHSEGTTELLDCRIVNASQFKRYLAGQGCTFESKRKGSGHLRRGDRKSELPMHGGARQLGKGLVAKTKKDLGIE